METGAAPPPSASPVAEFALPHAEAAPAPSIWLEPNPEPPASGKWRPSTLPFLLFVAIGSGIAIGWLFQFIEQFKNLFLIFPLLQGFILGLIMVAAIGRAKCRRFAVGAWCGLLAGLVCHATIFYLDSRQLRPELVRMLSTQLQQKKLKVTAQEADQIAKHFLDTWTTLHLTLRIREDSGIYLTDSSSAPPESSKDAYTGKWYWAITILELLALTLVAAMLGGARAGSRFCEDCEQWYQTKKLFACHGEAAAQMVDLVRAVDWQAASMLASVHPAKDDNKCEVKAECCPKCAAKDLKITLSVGKKTNQELFRCTLPRVIGDRLQV